jgi:hypothetical protein
MDHHTTLDMVTIATEYSPAPRSLTPRVNKNKKPRRSVRIAQLRNPVLLFLPEPLAMLVCEYKLELKVDDEFKAAILYGSYWAHNSFDNLQLRTFMKVWNTSSEVRPPWMRIVNKGLHYRLCMTYCTDMGFV